MLQLMLPIQRVGYSIAMVAVIALASGDAEAGKARRGAASERIPNGAIREKAPGGRAIVTPPRRMPAATLLPRRNPRPGRIALEDRRVVLRPRQQIAHNKYRAGSKLQVAVQTESRMTPEHVGGFWSVRNDATYYDHEGAVFTVYEHRSNSHAPLAVRIRNERTGAEYQEVSRGGKKYYYRLTGRSRGTRVNDGRVERVVFGGYSMGDSRPAENGAWFRPQRR